ncbi:hypothetical protein HNR25_001820 [Streptomonospora salina]|uniref:DUF8033 domain-containing protein n=1 Tax=Streptomonospora salina TaxID=104205 RepID=A0A841E9T4_9ACTN|nr:hypothetical protein [Streptomonospora salina]
MARASIRSDARRLISARKPFRTHGALYADDFPRSETGRMPPEWAEAYRSDREGPGISYAVYSYATPIAWVRCDGVPVIPEVGYSVTTTRHQNLCRAWLE